MIKSDIPWDDIRYMISVALNYMDTGDEDELDAVTCARASLMKLQDEYIPALEEVAEIASELLVCKRTLEERLKAGSTFFITAAEAEVERCEWDLESALDSLEDIYDDQ